MQEGIHINSANDGIRKRTREGNTKRTHPGAVDRVQAIGGQRDPGIDEVPKTNPTQGVYRGSAKRGGCGCEFTEGSQFWESGFRHKQLGRDFAAAPDSGIPRGGADPGGQFLQINEKGANIFF
jgi:hypothetical protein